MIYDVAIVGGGPAGLSAALALGRARKRVFLCDAGPRRNAAAQHIHNFVTRDGTPPEVFRTIGREQLAHYPNVEARASHVESISGERGAFRLQLSEGTADARRILLATGMLDETLPIEGFREFWGRGIYQCPYCHGWEVQDRRWGYLVRTPEWSHVVPFVAQLRGWTCHVTLFTTENFELPDNARLQLEAAGVRVELSPVKRLVGRDAELAAVELTTGANVACDVLFAHPPQQQVALIKSLGLALDNDGFVAVDPLKIGSVLTVCALW